MSIENTSGSDFISQYGISLGLDGCGERARISRDRFGEDLDRIVRVFFIEREPADRAALAVALVDVDQRRAQRRFALRGVEAPGKPTHHAFERLLYLQTNDRFVASGHPDIADV